MQAVEMLVRHNHGVSRGERKGIQDDDVILATVHSQRLLVVSGSYQFAEDASRHLAGSDVCVTPRGPQIIHIMSRVPNRLNVPNGPRIAITVPGVQRT